ncbi:UNVERIFIED_CONTAM: hypothetical protein DES50_104304 [Williamsia faeni]
MVPASVSSSALFHLRLEDMADSAFQFVADPSFVIAEHRPVGVVELFDDLECPPPFDDVAADQIFVETVGDLAMPGRAKVVGGVTEQQVGVTHQLVERIQMTAGALEALQRFRKFSDSSDGVVIDTVRASKGRQRFSIGFGHRCQSTPHQRTSIPYRRLSLLVAEE